MHATQQQGLLQQRTTANSAKATTTAKCICVPFTSN
jgi:hypothetical protein